MSIPTRCLVWLVFLLLGSVLPTLATLDPPPDGGYPVQNTAEGDGALDAVTDGSNCTAVGFQALNWSTIATYCTAIGSQALFNNVSGGSNTAVGAGALEFSVDRSANTAVGTDAMLFNKGEQNTAVGVTALEFNEKGSNNTAMGYNAEQINMDGSSNAAFGYSALRGNKNGSGNTAVGSLALYNCTAHNNTAIGSSAGINIVSGSNNIFIGSKGKHEDNNTTRIGSNQQTQTFISGISGTTVAEGVSVFIDSTGKLGTVTSSARYKKNIQPMNRASEKILSLRPVTFEYKEELDPKAIPQFGLVAEQVEKVDPDLVARDEAGKPYTVRYEAVNAMLLNEFLKEHRKVEELQATVEEMKETLEKVCAQRETSNSQQTIADHQ